jgi:ATP-binding cassette subfamily B protein
MFSHVLSLSQKQMKSLKTGSFVTRITNDTQNLSAFFSDLLPSLIRNSVSLVIIIVICFIKTSYFGFIFVAYLPVSFLLAYLFQKKAAKYYMGEKNSISRMNSFLSESFGGISVIKTYNREEKKLYEFDEKNNTIYHYHLLSQNLFAFFYPSMYFLQVSCQILLSAFCIPAIYNHPEIMTVGSFYLLLSYASQFFQPIQQIAQLLNSFSSVLSSATRCSFVLDMEPEIVSTKDALAPDSFKGKIEFRHVYFRYEDSKKEDDYVLKDVSFVIYPGKTVAFVGATGAGKSTIISLISRTYDATKGEILIDDVDIRKYSLESLRKNIGMMMQDVFLFSGTIGDNISLGDKKVTKEEVISSARYVGADSFIEKLPGQYDEKVVEKGGNFSAGERQLISFARTLTYHPSLMLLDEATANIDTETEQVIQNSLKKMRSIGTMIIVAHRLSTIKDADHIFVVGKGKILEEGNHQELLKMHGTYYNLYRLQNLEQNLGKENREEVANG